MERVSWGEAVTRVLFAAVQSLVGCYRYGVSSSETVQRLWEWAPDSGLVSPTTSEVALPTGLSRVVPAFVPTDPF